MTIEPLRVLVAAVPSALWRGVLPVSSLVMLFCVQRRRRQRRLPNQTGEQSAKRQARLRAVANHLAQNEDEIEWQIERAGPGSNRPRF